MANFNRAACLLVLALLTFCSWLYPANSPAQELAERILDFNSDIIIRPDAVIRVTETIKVQSARQQIKRGIYRQFPTTYRNNMGQTVKVRFEVLEVLRNGRPEPYHVTDVSHGKRVYIGRSDVFLPPGIYTYTISYLTDRQLGYFEDFDELYWNVTGHNWAFPIDRARAVIELPPGGKVLQCAAYTGYLYEQGQNFEQGWSDGHITFTTVKPLLREQGLTVSVAFPKGLVYQPTIMDKIDYFIRDYPNAIVGLVFLGLVFFYYFFAWAKVGRDPKKGTIFPLYSPPTGFSPGAARYIMRMGFDHKTFTTAVVSLAVKGYLMIEDQEGDYTLHRLPGSGAALSPGEKKILTQLFGNRKSIHLKRSNHDVISEAISSFRNTLGQEYEKIYFFSNTKHLLPGLVLTLLGLLGILLTSPDRFLSLFMGLWLSIWSFGCFFLGLTVYRAWRTAGAGGNSSRAMMLTFFSLPFFGGELFGLSFLISNISWPATAALLSLVFINMIFYQWLKAPTKEGRRLMDLLEGFKLYLGTAEKDRLASLTSGNINQELFEKYLPYALALDVENEWGDKFSEMLSRSGQSSYTPTWYRGGSFNRLGATAFATSLGGGFSSAISTSSTAPGSSSGSGGGGFSGGGGGGGGGGGW